MSFCAFMSDRGFFVIFWHFPWWRLFMSSLCAKGVILKINFCIPSVMNVCLTVWLVIFHINIRSDDVRGIVNGVHLKYRDLLFYDTIFCWFIEKYIDHFCRVHKRVVHSIWSEFFFWEKVLTNLTIMLTMLSQIVQIMLLISTLIVFFMSIVILSKYTV